MTVERERRLYIYISLTFDLYCVSHTILSQSLILIGSVHFSGFPFLVCPNSDPTRFFKVYQTGDLANLSGLGHEEKCVRYLRPLYFL